MAEQLNEPPTQSRRRRWATPLAAMTVVMHGFAGLLAWGWFYFFVPRWKYQFDTIGLKVSDSVMLLINIGDLVVNLGLLIPAMAVPILIADFFVMRWIARQMGLRAVLVFGTLVSLALLGNIVVGQYIMHQG